MNGSRTTAPSLPGRSGAGADGPVYRRAADKTEQTPDALELIDDGIKVNAICPGNFFDGPLWSDPQNGLFAQYLRTGKVPGAKTIEDVRKSYEDRVPMKRGCTTEDVMKAVYYIIDQQYETGQAIPVTGGQTMLS